MRLIGGLVVFLLIVGPLLDQVGLLSQSGLLHQLVDLEMQGFAYLGRWVVYLWHGGHAY